MARSASVTDSPVSSPLLQRMRTAIALLALGSSVGIGGPSLVHAQGPGIDELIVRTYDPGGLLAERIVTARQAADEILRRAGVSLRWRHCDFVDAESQTSDGACPGPLAANEVVVRIATAPGTFSPGVLGFTYIDHSANRSWLATMFADRITATADRVRLPLEVLTGRVMAHELGHLLMEQPGHAKAGFMRAVWGDEMLQRNHPSDWVFAPREAGRVRRNAIVRAQSRDPQMLALATESSPSNEPQ
jgi:hypothetical protein